MSAWRAYSDVMESPSVTHPTYANDGTSLSEIMREQESQNAREEADLHDADLQEALKLSAEEAKLAKAAPDMACSFSDDRPCGTCTFLNKPTALACEMCGSILIEDTPPDITPGTTKTTTGKSSGETADTDFAIALALQEHENKATGIRRPVNPDPNHRAHERDPMWKAKHSTLYDRDDTFDRSRVEDGEDEESNGVASHDHEGNDIGGIRGRRGGGGADWVTLEDGSIVTKHDPEINGRGNARLASDYLSGIGDLDDDVVLPNTEYNSLKKSIRRVEGVVKGVYVKGKVAGETVATREGVLDPRTRKILFKLINKSALEEIHGVVKTGKESRIYHALGVQDRLLQQGKRHQYRLTDNLTETVTEVSSTAHDDLSWDVDHEENGGQDHDDEGSQDSWEDLEGGDDNGLNKPSNKDQPHGVSRRIEESQQPDNSNAFHAPMIESLEAPTSLAVKVFFTTLNQFSNRKEYVIGDPRYRNTKFGKQRKRQMIHTWAEKEYRNLIRVHRCGIASPKPLQQIQHVLIMAFLGKDGWPAPQLHELAKAPISQKLWSKIYAQTIGLIRDLWQYARLVHCDLSEFNILFLEKRCYIIDVGQAIDTGHTDALSFLRRDIANVLNFFRSHKFPADSNAVVELFVTAKDSFSPEFEAIGEEPAVEGSFVQINTDGNSDWRLASSPDNEGAVLSALLTISENENAIELALKEGNSEAH